MIFPIYFSKHNLEFLKLLSQLKIQLIDRHTKISRHRYDLIV